MGAEFKDARLLGRRLNVVVERVVGVRVRECDGGEPGEVGVGCCNMNSIPGALGPGVAVA